MNTLNSLLIKSKRKNNCGNHDTLNVYTKGDCSLDFTIRLTGVSRSSTRIQLVAPDGTVYYETIAIYAFSNTAWKNPLMSAIRELFFIEDMEESFGILVSVESIMMSTLLENGLSVIDKKYGIGTDDRDEYNCDHSLKIVIKSKIIA